MSDRANRDLVPNEWGHSLSSLYCNVSNTLLPLDPDPSKSQTNRTWDIQGSAGPCFVNWDRDQEISQLGPEYEIWTGNSISQVSLSGPGSGMYFNQSR